MIDGGEWGPCDRCGDRPGVYPVHDRDWYVAYVLCRECRREVRYWSGRDRETGRRAPLAVPLHVRDRVIP